MTADLSHLFTTAATRDPSSVAVSFVDRGRWVHWTYERLLERVAVFRQQLAAGGVQPGDRVALVSPRHPDAIAAMLAVLGLRAAYVPIDPRDPLRRRELLAGQVHCVARVAVADRAGEQPLAVAVGGAGREACDPTSPEVAYVLFTSGSTGEPKGVLVPRSAVVRLVVGQDYLRFGPQQVFLQAAPLTFDISVLEIFAPLLHGGRSVLLPVAVAPTALGLREAIAANGVNTACLSTAWFHLLADRDPGCFAGLSEMVIGGEELDAMAVRRVQRAVPALRMVNGYGPTENGVAATTYELPSPLPDEVVRVPIGRPLAGTEVAVVDDHLQPAPDGEAGELLLLGDGLALGYLGQPAATARSFVSATAFGGRRAYRTGDRGRRRRDGVFEFLGRADEQTKIDGHRVEPGETEQWLRRCPGVRDARVVIAADAAGVRRLVAYAVLAGHQDSAQLLAAARAELPAYLVPAAVVRLDELPLTAHGKLAKERLPTPFSGQGETQSKGAADLSAAVAAAWRSAVGPLGGGPDANLFDAGARSLDAVRLHEQLERIAGRPLPPTFVYEHPTQRRQTAALGQAMGKR